jgi:poly(3-hydroxybutyrate) depolymerase
MLETYTQQIGGFWRSWKIYVPDNHVDEKVPVLIALHGAGGPSYHKKNYWHEKAQREHFIFLMPEAVAPLWWNGWCKGGNVEPDDVEYLDWLIEWVKDKYPVNEERIYLMGYSMGDMMASTYAFKRGENITAAAFLVGPSLPSNLVNEQGELIWKPKYTMPVLRVKGEIDFLSGFPSTHRVPNEAYYAALDDEEREKLIHMNNWVMNQLWIEANECQPQPHIVVDGEKNYLWYQGTNDFCFLSVSGFGHCGDRELEENMKNTTLPMEQLNGRSLDKELCDVVWDFLKDYTGRKGSRNVHKACHIKDESAEELKQKKISSDLKFALDVFNGRLDKPTLDVDFEWQCLKKVKLYKNERNEW